MVKLNRELEFSLKTEALNLAIKNSFNSPSEDVVKVANRFYSFLTGADTDSK